MKTLESLGKEYAEKTMHTANIGDYPKLFEVSEISFLINKSYKEGYIEGMRDFLTAEQCRKINLERVYSFHQEAIKLIEKAMKELE